MNYLLNTLNHTSSRANAVKDFIKLGFSIDPRDIRYDDTIPAMISNLGDLDNSSRSVVITERLSTLLSRISTSISVPININSITEDDSGVNVSIKVQEEIINILL